MAGIVYTDGDVIYGSSSLSEGMIVAGDKLTIEGVFECHPNTDRRWWQVWKPKTVVTDKLAQFTII